MPETHTPEIKFIMRDFDGSEIRTLHGTGMYGHTPGSRIPRAKDLATPPVRVVWATGWMRNPHSTEGSFGFIIPHLVHPELHNQMWPEEGETSPSGLSTIHVYRLVKWVSEADVSGAVRLKSAIYQRTGESPDTADTAMQIWRGDEI